MRVLLVSPAFHGYHSAISAALSARGHDVATHVYDDHGGLVGRAAFQVRHQLPHKLGAGSLRRLGREETERAASVVEDSRPDAVLVVKGDTLGPRFWESLTGLPRVTWLYDELRRTRYSVDVLTGIGPIATYSAHDHDAFASAALDSRHLPLAYDHRLVPAPTGMRTHRVSFVGARYPVRASALTHLHDHGVPVVAYGRDWSKHPVDRLRTWRIGAPSIPAERDVSRATAYDVMASSAATLNLHGDQDGFTMRTFEASGVGAVQLVDRTDVDPLYEPGAEVLTFSSQDELLELCRRVALEGSYADRIRVAARRRTLAEHTFDHRAAVLEGAWDTPRQTTS